ncbi:hypothetical protein V1294_007268 [Bradyrhizobium sp. AZCC 1678]
MRQIGLARLPEIRNYAAGGRANALASLASGLRSINIGRQ